MDDGHPGAGRVALPVLTVFAGRKLFHKDPGCLQPDPSLGHKAHIIAGQDDLSQRNHLRLQLKLFQGRFVGLRQYLILHFPKGRLKIPVDGIAEPPQGFFVVLPAHALPGEMPAQLFHPLSHGISVNMYHSDKAGLIFRISQIAELTGVCIVPPSLLPSAPGKVLHALHSGLGLSGVRHDPLHPKGPLSKGCGPEGFLHLQLLGKAL